MSVVEQHAHLISYTGRRVEVNPFTLDYDAMQIPIIDAAVRYDCPYNRESYILLILNTLHVSSMCNNMLMPFVLREVGIEFHKHPKIQVKILLWMITRYNFLRPAYESLFHYGGSFHTLSCPYRRENMMEMEEVYMLTPSVWNNYCAAYSANEVSMID